jgi:phage gpG-like protein
VAETVRVDFTELMAVADELTANARDLPRVMNVVAEALVSEVHDTFQLEGATGGNPHWPPLAASTLRKRAGGKAKQAKRIKSLQRVAKRRLAAGKFLSEAQRNALGGLGTVKILQDKGVLVGSITPDWGEQSGEIYAEAYTNVPYAVFHISPEPRRIIPLRDFFVVDEAHFQREVLEITLNTLTRRR